MTILYMRCFLHSTLRRVGRPQERTAPLGPGLRTLLLLAGKRTASQLSHTTKIQHEPCYRPETRVLHSK